MVFDNNGVKDVHNVFTWSHKNGKLCDKVNIDIKGSGRRKFVYFGLAAESIESDVDRIINEEYVKLVEQLNILNEGKIWDTIKSGFDSATTWVKKSYEKIEALVLDFYEKVIKKVIESLWEAFQKGLTPILEKLGYIMEGTCSLTTPVW